MAFCSKCGKQLTEKDRFCSSCGNAVQTTLGTNKKIPTYFILSVVFGTIIVAAVLLKDSISFSETNTNKNPTAAEVAKTSVAADGRLQFINDTYVIVTGSFAETENIRREVEKLRSEGEIAGYFQRSEFPPLKSGHLFSTFIGLYESAEACKQKLYSLQPTPRDYYILKLSKVNETMKIR